MGRGHCGVLALLLLSLAFLLRPRCRARQRHRSALRSRRTRTAAPSSSHTSAPRPSASTSAFWFMEDARYTAELIAKWQGRACRSACSMDSRANADLPAERARASTELQNAGIPMRKRFTQRHPALEDDAVPGQSIVEFSGANYSAGRLAAARDAVRTRTTSTRRSTSPTTRRSSTASGRSTTISGSTRPRTRTTRTSPGR